MKNYTVVIRPPEDNDILQLEELFLFTQQQTFRLRPESEFRMGDYIKSVATDQVLIAAIEDEIVGFVSFQVENNFVHNLFVHPNYQNKRIGSILLKAAEEKMSLPINLKVAADNAKVGNFYKKHGYEIESMNLEALKPYIIYRK